MSDIVPTPEPATAMRPSLLSCLRCDDGSAVRVAVSGELDIATASEFDHALGRAEAHAGLVVLDLRELEFMDASAGWLMLAADRRIRRAGGRLVVVPGAEVARTFELIGIDRQLELVDQPPAAAAASPVWEEGVPA